MSRRRRRPRYSKTIIAVSMIGLLLILTLLWYQNVKVMMQQQHTNEKKVFYGEQRLKVIRRRDTSLSETAQRRRTWNLSSTTRRISKQNVPQTSDNQSMIPGKLHAAVPIIANNTPDSSSFVSDLIHTINSTEAASVRGDVSRLLDFAIVGFPKTGTTTLLHYLSRRHANVIPVERCDLVVDRVPQLVGSLIELNGDKPRGIKCPQDISSHASLHNYATYFPNTRLIVGIRHPIRWMESFYNFRIRSRPDKKLLPTSALTGRCIPGSQGVCGWRASFADFLATLGKTSMNTTDELELLELGLQKMTRPVGKVFLYEIGQLSSSSLLPDKERNNNESVDMRNKKKMEHLFQRDLVQFIGAKENSHEFSFSKMIHISSVDLFLDDNPRWKEKTQSLMIDICDDEHIPMRKVLLDKAQRACLWIQNYFLRSEDVVVSSQEYFVTLLEEWMQDPCET